MSTTRLRSSVGRSLLLCGALAAGLAACAPVASMTIAPSTTNLHRLSAQQISRMTGNTAWDVLTQSGAPLSVLPNGELGPTTLMRRGQGSMAMSEDPLVIVDHVRTVGLEWLHHIPRRDIEEIQVLSGLEATSRYGVGAGGGAIVIRTVRARGR